MFNLNKVIYYLLMALMVQLGVLAIFMIFENFSEEEKVAPLNVAVSTKSETPIIKSQLLNIKVEELSINTLEDALVHITPDSKDDIVRLDNKVVKPIIYTKSVKLDKLSIQHKKETFIDMLIPSILVAKHRISKERKKVAKLLNVKELSAKESLWLTKKRHIFKASDIDDLYAKMKLHPTSIVIAQAIIESGWGTSRFFEKANNVFGIWSFNEHESRIAASEKRGEKTVFLKKYKSMEESVYDYFLVLSTKDAYKEFRERRLESQDPFVLIEELGRYSELGKVYIENLKNTIEKNELLAYDSYRLDI
ncbi:MAG: BAX protein [uncultured Sulfurovum sp.]|uniref:BAX protein n=1 Tax=uncultured Sulfurovum sp. TaxID=269237 RepID=A0A6S6SVU0_9BACT|nr:MAG: BAX protein [uncultured Sulfurovum sp.]